MPEKKRILIVEDDKVLRENTATFLSKSGFDVFSASNGLVGIQKAIALIPDLIISDIIMPELNGYDFFKALQQIPATAVIPFIFLSSKAEAQDIRSGMTLGVDDYLTKPFDYSELIKVVNIRITKSERLLEAGEKKFLTLIDNKLTGVFVYKDNNLVLANRKFQQISEYSEEELQRMNFTDLIADEDRDAVIEQIEALKDGLDSDMMLSFSIQKKSGSVTKVKFYAGVSKQQWKTIITAVVIESNGTKPDTDPQEDFPSDFSSMALSQIAREYSGNLKITEKYRIKGSLDHLTRRELEILQHIANGKTNHQIAEILFISPRTVEFHRSNLLSKTNTKNTAELIRFAFTSNLIHG